MLSFRAPQRFTETSRLGQPPFHGWTEEQTRHVADSQPATDKERSCFCNPRVSAREDRCITAADQKPTPCPPRTRSGAPPSSHTRAEIVREAPLIP